MILSSKRSKRTTSCIREVHSEAHVELAIMKLQDQLSWEIPRGPQGTTGQKAVSTVEKKNKVDKYKDILDKQLQERVSCLLTS